MKTILMTAMLGLVGLGACTAKSEKNGETAEAVSEGDSKMLVCYFSATGTTERAARRLADITGGDLYEITPVERYTDADLDWRDTLSRSYVEMHNPSSRPAIVDSLPDMTKYDVVFIGYPNWWNTHPTIINTFIEAVDLKDKKVAPVMTSGGSTIANSEKELRETYPNLTFTNGLLMNSVSDSDIKAWTDSIR